MITVYTKQSCPKCVMAKNLLNSKKVNYNTVEISYDDSITGDGYISRAQFMAENPNVKELPFIVDGTTIIGNFNQLMPYLNTHPNV